MSLYFYLVPLLTEVKSNLFLKFKTPVARFVFSLMCMQTTYGRLGAEIPTESDKGELV